MHSIRSRRTKGSTELQGARQPYVCDLEIGTEAPFGPWEAVTAIDRFPRRSGGTAGLLVSEAGAAQAAVRAPCVRF
jgi:hypothetical protein